MSVHERRKHSSGDPQPQSPVSVISRFSYEEHGDSNNWESAIPRHESIVSRKSAVSASSQHSTSHIGLARPLSAAIISSNERFASSAVATPDIATGNGGESTEQIFNVKETTVTTESLNQHDEQGDEGKRRPMCNPFWLWRTTLIGFVLVFVLLVVSLVVAYHFSNLHHGLSAQISRNHYSWTYGPTAGGLILRYDEAAKADWISFHDSTMFVAANRLLLQNPFPLERDAGPIGSSRKEPMSRLHLPWPHKRLIGRVE